MEQFFIDIIIFIVALLIGAFIGKLFTKSSYEKVISELEIRNKLLLEEKELNNNTISQLNDDKTLLGNEKHEIDLRYTQKVSELKNLEEKLLENKAEVEKLGIHVGCVITYPDEFHILNKDKFVCRALDNRMGGFMIAEVARLLHENKKNLPFGLYVVNSVQEEIGLRGAEMITQNIKPNVAIVTDVTHDTTTPMIEKKTQGDLEMGKGPVIAYAPAVQQKLRDLITDTAEAHKIPFQRNALSRATGTDTDAFAYSNGGVASALISLPLRYMHTTVEMVHKEDVENVIRLIYESLLNIKDGETFSYFK